MKREMTLTIDSDSANEAFAADSSGSVCDEAGSNVRRTGRY